MNDVRQLDDYIMKILYTIHAKKKKEYYVSRIELTTEIKVTIWQCELRF